MRRFYTVSIRTRLLLLIQIPLIVLMIIAGGWSIHRASQAVNDVHDQQMAKSADILLSFLFYELQEEKGSVQTPSEEPLDKEIAHIVDHIKQQFNIGANYRVRVNKNTIFTTPSIQSFNFCPENYSNFTATDTAERWRCYSKQLNLSHKKATVIVEFFDRLSLRDTSTRAVIYSTFTPFLAMPLVIFFGVLWAVKKGLKPLHRIQQQIAMRSVNHLNQLPTKTLPPELSPVVKTVNRLLASIEKGIEREKRFTDDAAHELRTPLTSMRMLSQLIQRENQDTSLNSHLMQLQRSIDRSSALIDKLLQIARLQSNKELLQNSTVNLHDTVSQQLGNLSPQITEKSLSVDICIDQHYSLVANLDVTELLLSNLLSNAIKFNQQDGWIYIYLNEGHLVIEDDGPGIAESERELIFERFYRSSKTAAEEEGSGLGLSIATRAAQLHHFTLRVIEPQKGSGAAFELMLRTET